MKIILSLILLIACSTVGHSQEKMIVFFKDKDASSVVNFSERALQRRAKNHVETDEHDVGISGAYLTALTEDGAILNTSRWLNAVSFSSFISKEELLSKHTFIQEIKVIRMDLKSTINKELDVKEKSLDYGTGFEQVDQLNLNCLHDMGFTGNTVFIGVIDAGFINMDTITYFDSVYLENRVLDTYDFVNSASVYAYSGHGTSVSSCIVGEKADPDKFIGTAKDVELALYVAEDVSSETEIEEFNVVAALERADSVGVDVINISLGYFDFDDTTTSHVYADMDGVTTIAAIGVNVAFTKGIVVSISAGNSGPSNIGTPCDADGCLCIGAVDEFDAYAFFSSVGPSADSQVKPDVASRGLNSWVISSQGNLGQGSGTSFSSPIMAGAIACLIQANPTKTAQEIKDAIRESASQFATPDNFIGYGIPDFCAANDILNDVTGIGSIDDSNINVYPVPSNDYLIINYLIASDQIGGSLINTLGERVIEFSDEGSVGKIVLDVRGVNAGVYFIELTDSNNLIIARKRVSIVD